MNAVATNNRSQCITSLENFKHDLKIRDVSVARARARKVEICDYLRGTGNKADENF